MIELDEFTRGYLSCAIWSSNDADGNALDRDYDYSHLSPSALERAVTDCDAFQRVHGADIAGRESLAGHDFWLTRNGHGSGFWDGDWAEEVGTRLTDASHAFGECDLYVGDDGWLYFAGGVEVRS